MKIQQTLYNNQNQPNFGAMAFKKITVGQDAHQASIEIAEKLGLDKDTFHTPYGTIKGVLLKFKTPDAEKVATEKAKKTGIKYVLLPDNNINKKNAKNAINNVE